MLIFNQRQLIHMLTEYERHYNAHRPHRALDQLSPMAAEVHRILRTAGAVRRRQVLGGLINEYNKPPDQSGLRFLSPTGSASAVAGSSAS